MVWVPGVRLGPDGADYDLSTQEPMLEEELDLMDDQLFPHGLGIADFDTSAKGLIVVAIHSALEAFALGVGVKMRRTALPKAIAQHLGKHQLPQLDSDDHTTLIELDETRHLVVHHRGLVSDRYVNNVPYNMLIAGELKTLEWADLERFVRGAWIAALRLKLSCRPGST